MLIDGSLTYCCNDKTTALRLRNLLFQLRNMTRSIVYNTTAEDRPVVVCTLQPMQLLIYLEDDTCRLRHGVTSP